jgi:hypothetical protein
MNQMAIRRNKWLSHIPNGPKIYQHLPFQGPPYWDFSFENIPSGNPDFNTAKLYRKSILKIPDVPFTAKFQIL